MILQQRKENEPSRAMQQPRNSRRPVVGLERNDFSRVDMLRSMFASQNDASVIHNSSQDLLGGRSRSFLFVVDPNEEQKMPFTERFEIVKLAQLSAQYKTY